jgi:hypothetical protein
VLDSDIDGSPRGGGRSTAESRLAGPLTSI